MANRNGLPPSLRCLRAFDAVARHSNVTLAAAELCVSQPAVTQQVKLLEQFLGKRLIRPERRGVKLTHVGATLAARVSTAFVELRDALDDAAGYSRERAKLTVAILTTFAQRWLIPRLPDFQLRHPEIEVSLLTTSRLVDLEREDVDMAIRVGDGHWPNCHADKLCGNDLFPVASPFLMQRQSINSVDDLRNHVLIHVSAAPRKRDWERWLDAFGKVSIQPAGQMSFANSAQALDAAAAGLGVAMAHEPFVELDIDAGRLLRPFPQRLSEANDFYLVTVARDLELDRVIKFREWILSMEGVVSGDF